MVGTNLYLEVYTKTGNFFEANTGARMRDSEYKKKGLFVWKSVTSSLNRLEHLECGTIFYGIHKTNTRGQDQPYQHNMDWTPDGLRDVTGSILL